MNVLTICPRLPYPIVDGGSQGSYNIIKAIAENHNLSVASLVSNKHLQDSEHISTFAEVSAVDGEWLPYTIPSILKSTFTRQPITIQHRMRVDLFEQAIKPFKGKKFDVITFHGIHPMAAHHLAKSYFPEAKTILHQFNTEYLLLRRRSSLESNLLKKIFLYDQSVLMENYEYKMNEIADVVSCVSTYDQALLNSIQPEVTTYTLHPVNPGSFPVLKEEYDENKIIAISNWEWDPNHHGLAWFFDNVWEMLKQKHPNVYLHIAGKDMPQYLLDKIKTLIDVEYVGYVDDVTDFKQGACMQIVPLFFGSGVKIKVIEAMAAGLPMVTTDIGAEGIPIEENRDFLLANEPDQFIDACSRLIKDKNLRNQISKDSQNTAQSHFTFENKVNKINELLELALSK